MAILGIGLLAVSETWESTARRQRLAQLDWIGVQYTQAIGSCYNGAPGSAKVYPASLPDLLDDRRFGTVRRHLREIYRNPLTVEGEWEVVKAPEGGIRGVRAVLVRGSESTIKEFVFAP